MNNQISETLAYSYIRFSTPQQLKGDSLRRQLERSEAYAKANNLRLVESYRDLGVSAFKGKNRTSGALKLFLTAVEQGRIQIGSYLLIEDMDRLSRESVEEALPRFIDLIKAGIVIVTLIDGQVYRKGLGMPQLVYSLTKMSIAHEENLKRQDRLSHVWATRRKNAMNSGQRLSGWCPNWLRKTIDERTFEPIAERVAIIRRIFKDTINGKGRATIAKELNSDKIPSWDRRYKDAGWHSTYIAKILVNRAVLGEYALCKMNDGRRTPTGDIVHGYYPAIIDQTTFNLAQVAATSRRTRYGRVSLTSKNIFPAKLLLCGECGGPLTLDDKGRGKKYLVCQNWRRGVSKCDPHRCDYDAIERRFISWCVDFDFTDSSNGAHKQKVNALAALDAEKQQAEKKLQRLLELAENSEMEIATLRPRIQSAQMDINLAMKSANTLRGEIVQLNEPKPNLDFQKLSQDSNNRFKLREEIGKRFESVTIYFGDGQTRVALRDGREHVLINDKVAARVTKEFLDGSDSAPIELQFASGEKLVTSESELRAIDRAIT